ncbi:MAG TPA: peptidase domain-containing ABC transporter [Gammaproteobacteria bacterium]|nr:peptidase domain-containing ABC transporter [Gammaproteobacteria bacterium]
MTTGGLNFTGTRRLPVILQNEAAECGLACLTMVSVYHGHQLDLATLRRQHGVSLKGVTLADLMKTGAALGFTPRPLSLDMEHLPQLRLPAILHWDMNHFVVLKKVSGKKITIHDPAKGEQTLSPETFSKHFTGVALELTPVADFKPQTGQRQQLRLRDLWRGLTGLGKSFSYILLVSLALQGFALLSPLFMQLVVDEVLLGRDMNLLTVLGIGFLLLVLIRVTTEALRSGMVLWVGTHLNVHMMSRLFHKLLRLPMDFFEKRHVGDIVSRFDSVQQIQRTLTTGFIEAIVDGLVMVPLLVMMFIYSIKLALIAIGAVVLYLGLRLLLYRPLRAATEEQIVCEAKRQSNFLESVRGTQSIKLFNREVQREGRWQNLLIDGVNASLRVSRLQIGYQFANTLLFGVETVAVIWVGALAIMDGAFSVGMLFAFMAWKRNFSDKSIRLVERIIEYRMLGLHAERVADVALMEAEDKGANAPSLTASSKGELRVSNLAFRYAANEDDVLKDINLAFKPGESVAITGPSGCGKTTLIKLMTGLLRPTAGKIHVDGQELYQHGLEAYRDRIGVVMQDDQLFSGSIAENISFFDTRHDQRHAEQCAKTAAIHEDILAMPMGYQTLIGDMGTVLSGGQKQRVLLARALYKKPDILFLDEATSHLDVAKENWVNESIAQLNITRIIVAHRPETIKSADRVIELEPTVVDDHERKRA